MNIPVVLGRGEGQTLLSSFDAALKSCGVHNYNLLYLSSIIPPGSHVVRADRFQAPAEQYGHRAYVIKAEERSDSMGVAIGAGLGWYQFEDQRGIFVEHHVQTTDEKRAEQILRSDITRSIQDLCALRKIPFQQQKAYSALSIAMVRNNPTCVLALAIYHTETWTNVIIEKP